MSGLFGAHAVLPVRPEEPDDTGDEDQFDTEVKAVEDGFEAWVAVPSVAEFHAYICKNEAPGPGAEEGVEVKTELRHAGDASG